jgi:tetratricopeptide (TPR) repeat protein
MLNIRGRSVWVFSMWRRMLPGLIAVVCCYGGYWSLRVGYAAYVAADFDKAALERGIRWAPGNPDYYAGLAEADPKEALAAVRKAVDLNPYSSSIWMEYSKVAEARMDFGQAEACLLKAVRLDNTFAPRWLLSEYYYRRRDTERFWPAVKAAFAASYDDVSPLFQECWDLTTDGDVVLQTMPPRADVLSQYLNFLVQQKNRLDLALPVATRLQGYADQDIIPPMLSFCDRLLLTGQVAAAVRIWDGLARAKFVPYAPLSPERGEGLTNGKLVQPFLEHGFDWRMPPVDGVYARGGGAKGSLQLTFSGKQPENCELLSQWLALSGSRRYKLRVRYETDGVDGETGLVWRILDAKGGADLLNGSGRLFAGAGAEREFVFLTSANTTLAKLVLGYGRVLGTGRIGGSVAVSEVSLGFAE